jgi:FAD/FMN-containing dehydrogenase
MIIKSWGRAKPSLTNLVNNFELSKTENAKLLVTGSMLSYGDSCLNSSGNLYINKKNDCILEFHSEECIIKVESGITFDSLLKFLIPRGFFLPVTPGTKYLTVGGAVSNDIHGKNHHSDGNFGHSIIKLTLVRSEGVIQCSHNDNSDLFNATIGGLGLTGYIQDCTFKLIKISSSSIEAETIKFFTADDFFKISKESEKFKYTVAWIDCFSSNKEGELKGLYMRGNHSLSGDLLPHRNSSLKTIPFDLPSWTLSKHFVRLFNFLYFNKQLRKIKKSTIHYDPFFYPLDTIKSWNKIYGKSGFYQFQCVIPADNAQTTILELLHLIRESGQGSFLSVLKAFGSIPSLGLLSFPFEGITLSLDFPNRGSETQILLEKLYATVQENKGRIYPAKDQFLSKTQFESMYPDFDEFNKHVDPKFSSDWWRRVRNIR